MHACTYMSLYLRVCSVHVGQKPWTFRAVNNHPAHFTHSMNTGEGWPCLTMPSRHCALGCCYRSLYCCHRPVCMEHLFVNAIYSFVFRDASNCEKRLVWCCSPFKGCSLDVFVFGSAAGQVWVHLLSTSCPYGYL